MGRSFHVVKDVPSQVGRSGLAGGALRSVRIAMKALNRNWRAIVASERRRLASRARQEYGLRKIQELLFILRDDAVIMLGREHRFRVFQLLEPDFRDTGERRGRQFGDLVRQRM